MSAVRFLPPAIGDVPEADRLTGKSLSLPHPREMLDLLGQGAAEQAFLTAYNAGKLHHAFLLTGPAGIGKATFAYRAARFLLAESEREAAAGGMFGPEVPETLAVEPGSRTAQLIAGRAHPDLGVIRRAYDAKTKKTRAEITVEDVRDTLTLFEKTAAFGGWRVIIVDAADDLNRNGANALLKTLEEPPTKAVFFLVAHRPEALLPTIRSRCQTLPFQPLEDHDLADLLTAFGGAAGREADVIARAEGSIRQALRYRDTGLSDALSLIERTLDALPKRLPSDIDRIAERLRGGAEAAEMLDEFLAAVERWLHRRIKRLIASGQGARGTEPLAECWARLQDRAARVDALNLDRRAFVIGVFEELAGLPSPSPRG